MAGKIVYDRMNDCMIECFGMVVGTYNDEVDFIGSGVKGYSNVR